MPYGMTPQYQMTAQAAHAASAISQGTLPMLQVHFQSQNVNYIHAATPQGFIINQPTMQPLAQQPTYHFQQPQQFIRTGHFSHVTSASGLNTEPKKIARVQPQIQSQQPARSISSASTLPATSLSSAPSSSRHPMASSSTERKVDPIKALSSMARTPMTSTAQDQSQSLSISHPRPPSIAPKTVVSDVNFRHVEESKPLMTVSRNV